LTNTVVGQKEEESVIKHIEGLLLDNKDKSNEDIGNDKDESKVMKKDLLKPPLITKKNDKKSKGKKEKLKEKPNEKPKEKPNKVKSEGKKAKKK